MSSFDARWRALLRACDRQEERTAASPERIRQLASLGLAQVPHGDGGLAGEWRSLALAAMLAVATSLGLWWSRLPVDDTAISWAQEIIELPRHIPRSPHLPSPATLLAVFSVSPPWSASAPPPAPAPPSSPETHP
jgi:hypothetical protein